MRVFDIPIALLTVLSLAASVFLIDMAPNYDLGDLNNMHLVCLPLFSLMTGILGSLTMAVRALFELHRQDNWRKVYGYFIVLTGIFVLWLLVGRAFYNFFF